MKNQFSPIPQPDVSGNLLANLPDNDDLPGEPKSPDAMLEALESCLEWMEFTIPRLKGKCPHCGKPVDAGGLNWGTSIASQSVLDRFQARF